MTGSNPPVYPVSGGKSATTASTRPATSPRPARPRRICDALLFGDGREIHAFTCEPFHNLVQHMIVEDDGVSFKARRAESGSSRISSRAKTAGAGP